MFKVIITGGPGTGKTSLIKELKSRKFKCYDEIIREFTQIESKKVDSKKKLSNPIVFAHDYLEFNSKLMNGRLRDWQNATDSNADLTFFDRGIPDVLAYMNAFNQKYPQSFIDTCNNNRYSHLFILPPWEEIYQEDAERFENFDERKIIYKALTSTYKSFGYYPIIVPKASVEERISFIFKHLQ